MFGNKGCLVYVHNERTILNHAPFPPTRLLIQLRDDYVIHLNVLLKADVAGWLSVNIHKHPEPDETRDNNHDGNGDADPHPSARPS